MKLRRQLMFAFLLCMLAISAGAQSWQNAQLLHPSSMAIKTSRIIASKDGGFYVVYKEPEQLTLRRYQYGTLGPEMRVAGWHYNANLCETPSGDIHVVWEHWLQEGVPVGWAVSRDCGQTWFWDTIDTNNSKYPVIASFGDGNSSQVVMTEGSINYPNVSNNNLRWAKYDGNSWSSHQHLTGVNSEYQLEGICRSPYDGSVWKIYGAGNTYIRRFNGSGWESPIQLATDNHFRYSIAANDSGQIMGAWSHDGNTFTCVYTPGSGVGPIAYFGGADLAEVTNIPGTNDFYMAYIRDNRVKGLKWSNGTWGSEELVSQGLGSGFYPDVDISAGPNGFICVCFEFWVNDNPRQYYTIKNDNPAPAMGTVTGTVYDQFGVGMPNATVGSNPYMTTTNSTGQYTMQVASGPREFSASKPYYSTHIVENFQVAAGTTNTLDFSIAVEPPPAVSVFSVASSDTINRLTWTNPDTGNYFSTVVRYKTDGYPTGPNDGILLCDRQGVRGAVDSYKHTDLTNGVTYYYAVFVRDDAYHYSPSITDQGTPFHAVCNYLRTVADDTIVDVHHKIITGIFPGEGYYYIEEENRTSGIRVQGSASGYTLGTRVSVTGYMDTLYTNGYPFERCIMQPIINWSYEGSALTPVAMPCKAVGGSAIAPNLPGVKDGVGLNNIGLLVKISGKVTAVVGNYIYVDDGSNIQDISGRVGVMVACPSAPTVSVGNIISVTGIVQGSIPTDWTTNRRFIRMRDNSDLTLISSNVGTISGIVLTNQGIPIAYALVSATGGHSAYTDNYGSYSLAVPAGDYTVEASADGYVSQSKDVTVYADLTTSCDFILGSTTGALTGYVRNSSGYGISGATVSTNTGGYSATTSSSGAYTISNVTAGTYTITASKAGYSSSSLTKTVNAGSNTYANFTLTQLATGTIAGVVKDNSNNAVSGAVVSTSTGGYSATTNSSGAYTLSNVVVGTYSVTASKLGFASATQSSVSVTANTTTTANFTLSPNAGTITGVVRNFVNAGLSGVTVSTSSGGYSAVTDAYGVYTIPYIIPGTYSVTASKSNYIAVTQSGVSVSAGQTSNADFVLHTNPVEALINGYFEGGFFSFWGGTIANNWGASFTNSAHDAHWNSYVIGGAYGSVQELYIADTSTNAGVAQRVTGLAPGSTYTFTAKKYQKAAGYTVYMAVDPSNSLPAGALPASGTAFPNATFQWQEQSVSGTVGSAGAVAVYVWVDYQYGNIGSVYLDGLSLMVSQ